MFLSPRLRSQIIAAVITAMPVHAPELQLCQSNVPPVYFVLGRDWLLSQLADFVVGKPNSAKIEELPLSFQARAPQVRFYILRQFCKNFFFFWRKYVIQLLDFIPNQWRLFCNFLWHFFTPLCLPASNNTLLSCQLLLQLCAHPAPTDILCCRGLREL